MVRTQVNLERDSGIPTAVKGQSHIGITSHKVMVGILTEEIHAEISGRELARSAHDHREELLLEGEPLQVGSDLLSIASAAAHLERFLVSCEIIIQLRILALVLITFLHTRDDRLEVHVYGIHLTRDIRHIHECQFAIHHI